MTARSHCVLFTILLIHLQVSFCCRDQDSWKQQEARFEIAVGGILPAGVFYLYLLSKQSSNNTTVFFKSKDFWAQLSGSSLHTPFLPSCSMNIHGVWFTAEVNLYCGTLRKFCCNVFSACAACDLYSCLHAALCGLTSCGCVCVCAVYRGSQSGRLILERSSVCCPNTEPPPCSQRPLPSEPFASETLKLQSAKNTLCLGKSSSTSHSTPLDQTNYYLINAKWLPFI